MAQRGRSAGHAPAGREHRRILGRIIAQLVGVELTIEEHAGADAHHVQLGVKGGGGVEQRVFADGRGLGVDGVDLGVRRHCVTVNC